MNKENNTREDKIIQYKARGDMRRQAQYKIKQGKNKSCKTTEGKTI